MTGLSNLTEGVLVAVVTLVGTVIAGLGAVASRVWLATLADRKEVRAEHGRMIEQAIALSHETRGAFGAMNAQLHTEISARASEVSELRRQLATVQEAQLACESDRARQVIEISSLRARVARIEHADP